MQEQRAKEVAKALGLMIVALRFTQAIDAAEEDLLWRAQEWLEGGERLTRVPKVKGSR